MKKIEEIDKALPWVPTKINELTSIKETKNFGKMSILC